MTVAEFHEKRIRCAMGEYPVVFFQSLLVISLIAFIFGFQDFFNEHGVIWISIVVIPAWFLQALVVRLFLRREIRKDDEHFGFDSTSGKFLD